MAETAEKLITGEAAGDRFEDAPSSEDGLTFEEATAVFRGRGADFGCVGGLTTPDGAFTNLALVLSDQCPQTTRVMRYEDGAGSPETGELGGSVLGQYQALEDLPRRLGEEGFPEDVLRNVIVNAFVHRDWSLNAPVMVNVRGDAVEVLSPGGVPHDFTVDDVLGEVLPPRNPRLLAVFRRLGLARGSGAGLREFLHLTEEDASHVRASGNTFRVKVAKNFSPDVKAEKRCPPSVKAAKTGSRSLPNAKVSEEIGQVFAYLQEHGEINDAELMGLLGVKKMRAMQVTHWMQKLGQIDVIGFGSERTYRLRR
ncbi:ATP-binding protein [Sutterella sp.]|uniref:ATP-binding protein n=1 Tax=Sutterella sp. TaxID=1981025 RepID=UPI0026E03FEF|nr:ATP-binding protein [Sutterella sp.]MDO5532196.1 ATP-binding protein [Sutterella sp.]